MIRTRLKTKGTGEPRMIAKSYAIYQTVLGAYRLVGQVSAPTEERAERKASETYGPGCDVVRRPAFGIGNY